MYAKYMEVFGRVCIEVHCASMMAQMVKYLPVVQETWVQSCVGKIPGEGNGNPLQYSCLENSKDRGAW